MPLYRGAEGQHAGPLAVVPALRFPQPVKGDGAGASGLGTGKGRSAVAECLRPLLPVAVGLPAPGLQEFEEPLHLQQCRPIRDIRSASGGDLRLTNGPGGRGSGRSIISRGIIGQLKGDAVASRLVHSPPQRVVLLGLRGVERRRSGTCLLRQQRLEVLEPVGREEPLQKCSARFSIGVEERRELPLRQHHHPGELLLVHAEQRPELTGCLVVARGFLDPCLPHQFAQQGSRLLDGRSTTPLRGSVPLR